METNNQTLTYKRIFIFWLPLASTWLMMALENPYLASIIARLPDPKYNLAAFGVSFSFALIFEAPIIMIMSASTALVANKDAFFKLRKFTYTLNAIVTCSMLIGLIPPLFYHVAERLIGLPHHVAQLTHTGLMLLLPWPAAIGYRRFYQGILIRNNLTRRVAYGTAVRLTSMSIAAFSLYLIGIHGAHVGAAALSIGVVCEAIASRIMANGSVKKLMAEEPKPTDEPPLTYTYIAKFYYPLALMSMLYLGLHPLMTFFVGKSRMPLESLAVIPVVNGLVFLFRCLGMSYMEVGVALLGKDNEGYIPLRNFAAMLFIFVVGGLSCIVFTPAASIWFRSISGLSLELSAFSYLPAQIMALLPGFVTFLSLQRAIMVSNKMTVHISWATVVEVGMMFAVMVIAIKYFNAIGAVAVASAYVMGSFAANLYFLPFHLRIVKVRK